MTQDSAQDDKGSTSNFGGAYLVASGILLSRISGLVRMRVLAHFLGNSEVGDAFYAAIKIPNFQQNLLGEGVLSASFIPVYAQLVAKGNAQEAGKVAGVILSFLSLVISLVVLLGVFLAPYFVDLVAPGFSGDKRDLTIRLVQILFPGTGLLVISAWCLGILNSHQKFFLSYAAPVLSNFAVIAVIIFYRNEPLQSGIAIYAAWGLVLGSLLQLLVQLPTTLPLVSELKLGFNLKIESVQQILKNFVPVVIGRGVVQLSAYIDGILASFLPGGAVATLGYAQTIYTLPISLFGMSVSAAELPAMSRAYGEEDFKRTLRSRISAASEKIAFFVVPTVVAFVLLGNVIAGLLFQSGQFDEQAANYVWTVLAGSAVGLLASTLGRLYSSAFYSLRDTKTPLRFAMIRVLLTTVLGYLMGLKLPVFLGIASSWGTAGLTASAGLSGWVEFLLLRKSLSRVIGGFALKNSIVAKLWAAALLSGFIALAAKSLLSEQDPLSLGILTLGVFGVSYLTLGRLLKISEAEQIITKVLKRLGFRY